MKDKLLDAGMIFLMCLIVVYLSPLLIVYLAYLIYKALTDPIEFK